VERTNLVTTHKINQHIITSNNRKHAAKEQTMMYHEFTTVFSKHKQLLTKFEVRLHMKSKIGMMSNTVVSKYVLRPVYVLYTHFALKN